MVTLRLDASEWQSVDDVWRALLAGLGAVPGHGQTLDALEESLRHGDLSALTAPLSVRVSHYRLASPDARNEGERISAMFRSLAEEGVSVHWRSV